MSEVKSSFIDSIRNFVRRIVHIFAVIINKLSFGKITPNMITYIGLVAHILIAYLIATRHNLKAAILLIIFGLFDTLDGELARLQKRESTRGMFIDASTDRFKEVMLYTAAAYSLIKIGEPYYAVWAVLACGASLSVSYVKAKGESAYLSEGHRVEKINSLFKQGFLRFEIRMVFLILGLLTNHLNYAVVVIAVLASITALDRFFRIGKKLDV